MPVNKKETIILKLKMFHFLFRFFLYKFKHLMPFDHTDDNLLTMKSEFNFYKSFTTFLNCRKIILKCIMQLKLEIQN